MDLLSYGVLFVVMTLFSTYGVSFAYRKVKDNLRHKCVFGQFCTLCMLH
jgi:hypothetical protein